MTNEESILNQAPVSLLYEARNYWEARARRFAQQGAGLRAVCSYGMPWFYNGYIHLTQRAALRRWLNVSAETRALEIGCGVGRWSRVMARRGASVVGVDLAPTMVAEARRRAEAEGLAGNCNFMVMDLASLALARQFDFILGVTVLQHVLDPDRFEASVQRLASHLAPGGRLVLLEAAPPKGSNRCDSPVFRARGEKEYLDAFTRAGLKSVVVTGVDPMPLKTLFLPWYRRTPRPLALASLAAVTALSLPVDLVASQLFVSASWHKVFVFTR